MTGVQTCALPISKNGTSGTSGIKWLKMAENGTSGIKWLKMAQVAQVARVAQNGIKWLKMAENG